MGCDFDHKPVCGRHNESLCAHGGAPAEVGQMFCEQCGGTVRTPAPLVTQLRLGLNITPWLFLLFITPRSGSENCRCLTHPCSSIAGCSPSHSQSIAPSPASGLTVKYPTWNAVRF